MGVSSARHTGSMLTRAPHLDHGVVILDGGMSNAVADLGHDVSGTLWTARLLRDAPEAIVDAHRAYFRAGAQVATTASYQASVPGFLRAGLDRREAEQLIMSSVRLAGAARDECADDGVPRWVAASVGPYGAVLADGSEYRGRYGLSPAELRDFHLPRLELLAAAGPDVLAVETIPDVDEAEVLVGLLDELGLPAWLSFSALGTRTRAGQPLEDAFALAASARTVFATGVNCCRPDDVLPAVRLVHSVTGLPAVAYPNSGARWEGGRWSGADGFEPARAREWVDAGAAYVGGCCRVGPDTIAGVARVLDSSTM